MDHLHLLSLRQSISHEGPPRRPGGVVALLEETTRNSTVVEWMEGSSGGGAIGVHVIQAAHEFAPSDWMDHTSE